MGVGGFSVGPGPGLARAATERSLKKNQITTPHIAVHSVSVR